MNPLTLTVATYFTGMVPTNLNKWINWVPNAPSQGNVSAQEIYEATFLPLARQLNISMVGLVSVHVLDDTVSTNHHTIQRWHPLEWYRSEGGYNTHWSRNDTCEQYRKHFRQRVETLVTTYSDVVYAWDVFNEVRWPSRMVDSFQGCPTYHKTNTQVVSNHKYMDECNLWYDCWCVLCSRPYQQHQCPPLSCRNTTFVDTWQQIATLAPTSLRCLNEMTFLVGGYQPNATADFMSYLDMLLEAGAPINCVGMQAHLYVHALGLNMRTTMRDLHFQTHAQYWSQHDQAQVHNGQVCCCTHTHIVYQPHSLSYNHISLSQAQQGGRQGAIYHHHRGVHATGAQHD